MNGLAFEDVTVRYGTGRHVLDAADHVTLSVPHGLVVGLVGESGSGKSTLARAAVGLAPIHSGRITLDGSPVPTRGSHRPVQMVFQDPTASLDPRMTVGSAIAEAAPRSLARSQRAAEVTRLMELVHLDPSRSHAYPGQLSGGQRQRVAIARALAARPRVVIADEITSNLDVSIQGAILNLVRELVVELDMTMLFISHNLAVVRYVASRVAVMRGGQIVEEGDTGQVLASPEHPYTRQLLAAIPGDHSFRESTCDTASHTPHLIQQPTTPQPI